MVDLELVVYQFLSEASPLKTLIGSNLFVDVTHDFNGRISKGLLLKDNSGTNNEIAPVHTSIMDFNCYGGSLTPADSKAVYRALHDRLHGVTNQVTASGRILSALEVVRGAYLPPVDDSDFPRVFCRYTVEVSGL
jgi:hypothetical protein